MVKGFDDLTAEDVGARVEFVSGGDTVRGGLQAFGRGESSDGKMNYAISVHPSGWHPVEADVEVRFLD